VVENVGQLVIFAGLFGVMYLVLIRPQRKKQQEQSALVAAITVGDDVVTIGGLHGSVVAVADDHIDLAVDAEGRVLRYQRTAVSRVVSEVPLADVTADTADTAETDDDVEDEDEA
jgi:preprotein translocase subunit YajC